jgi:hypothetical protein
MRCGAVRYRATEMIDNAHICHCRMCQKAVGNLFTALVATPRGALSWTRGKPATFMSSQHVARGFCSACGTPLFYDYLQGGRINLTMGSLDNPGQFPPNEQFGTEARISWFGNISALPDAGSTESTMPAAAPVIQSSNRQHPDYDTDKWP